MPVRRKGEPVKKYIPRCVSYLVRKEGYKPKQAVAVCYSMAKRKVKSSKKRNGRRR